MQFRKVKPYILGSGIAGAAAAIGYIYAIRPWHLRWGAGDHDVVRVFPGDGLVPHAKINATHAVTIQANPAQVWPWLVQLGQGRGGFYSYEWIENLMGLEIQNVDRILPEFQDLEVGDVIPLDLTGFGIPVTILEPERILVLHGDTRTDEPGVAVPVREGEHIAVSWGFYLDELADGQTRLIERWKADWTPTLLNNLFYHIFLEPGAFIMERRMLLGIKKRAERLSD